MKREEITGFVGGFVGGFIGAYTDDEIFKNLIKENAQKARTNVRVFFNNKYYNLFLQKFYLFYKYLLKILHLYYFLLFDNIVL